MLILGGILFGLYKTIVQDAKLYLWQGLAMLANSWLQQKAIHFSVDVSP